MSPKNCCRLTDKPAFRLLFDQAVLPERHSVTLAAGVIIGIVYNGMPVFEAETMLDLEALRGIDIFDAV